MPRRDDTIHFARRLVLPSMYLPLAGWLFVATSKEASARVL